jgi:hypothetical protein
MKYATAVRSTVVAWFADEALDCSGCEAVVLTVLSSTHSVSDFDL